MSTKLVAIARRLYESLGTRDNSRAVESLAQGVVGPGTSTSRIEERRSMAKWWQADLMAIMQQFDTALQTVQRS